MKLESSLIKGKIKRFRRIASGKKHFGYDRSEHNSTRVMVKKEDVMKREQ